MLKISLISNFVAKFITVILSLILIPYYIRYLGIEAYGLMGSFATIGACAALLDLGMGATIHREVARMTVIEEERGVLRTLVRTYEVVYWWVALLVLLITTLIAYYASHYWIPTDHPSDVMRAYSYMGFAMASLWPHACYSGVLIGLERHPLNNGLIILFGAFRSIGALLVLIYVAPTVELFFGWQIIVNLAQAWITSWKAKQYLPSASESVHFDWNILKKSWKFASHMSGISLTVLVISHLDKIILSGFVSMKEFGIYTLGITISQGLNHFTGPVSSVLFPRLTKAVTLNDIQEVKRLYHTSSQVITCLVLPVALCLILFPGHVLSAWGIHPETAHRVAQFLPILVAGTTLNCLLSMPYILQLAHGWGKLPLMQNIIALIVLIGPLTWASHRYGIQGACWIWLTLNLGYFFITVPIMHRKVLCQEMWTWYSRDCLFPALAGSVVVVLGAYGLHEEMSRWAKCGFLASICLIASIACCMTTTLRRYLRETVYHYYHPHV